MAVGERPLMSERLADKLALLQATPDFNQWIQEFGDQVIREGEACFLAVERDVPIRYVLEECQRVNRPFGLITDGPPGTGRLFVGKVGGHASAASIEVLNDMPPETTVGDMVDLVIWYGSGVAVKVEDVIPTSEEFDLSKAFV